ncbi:MAG: hypothetical protein MRZ13_01665 [Clostridiales bacterium]|nr:hypothetical protein [Clostridiales bacterium]
MNKLKKIVKYILIAMILIAFALSICAISKAGNVQEITQENAQELTEADRANIAKIYEKHSIGNAETIPYTQDGERRYLIIGSRFNEVRFYVYAVRDGELVIINQWSARDLYK